MRTFIEGLAAFPTEATDITLDGQCKAPAVPKVGAWWWYEVPQSLPMVLLKGALLLVLSCASC